MSDQRLRYPVILILCFVILLTACTRSASTAPPSSADEGTQSEEPIDDTQATMEAIRSGILTKTAQVEMGIVGTDTPQPAVDDTQSAPVDSTEQAVEATATPTLGGVVEYTVQAGDWIWKIARQFDVDPQVIIDYNNMASPSSLEVGMVLQIPISSPPTHTPSEPDETEIAAGTATPGSGGTTIHIVQAGEWIWQIARLYGVDPQAIIDANNLLNPSSISPGQELIIP
jgi:LysM repeat protein